MAITMQLPEAIEKQLCEEWPDLEGRVLEGFVLDAFQRGDLSSFEVAQILGYQNREEAIEFLSEHGAYPGYDLPDLEQDRQTFNKLEQSERE
ncbi:MAG: UPF0175 family protein [Armatimonadetes bacterium]|nr:UPF0175 family protein [Armatimonadota bacterium]